MYLRLPDSLALSRALVFMSCLTISNRSSSIASPAASLILIASSVALSSASTFFTAADSTGLLGPNLSGKKTLFFQVAGSTAPEILLATTPFIRASEVSLTEPSSKADKLYLRHLEPTLAKISMAANACWVARAPSLPCSKVRPRKSLR